VRHEIRVGSADSMEARREGGGEDVVTSCRRCRSILTPFGSQASPAPVPEALPVVAALARCSTMAATDSSLSGLEFRLEDAELALQAREAMQLLGGEAAASKQVAMASIAEAAVDDLTDAELDEAAHLVERELEAASAAATAAALFDQTVLNAGDGLVDVVVTRLSEGGKLGIEIFDDNRIDRAPVQPGLRKGDLVVRVNGVPLERSNGLRRFFEQEEAPLPEYTFSVQRGSADADAMARRSQIDAERKKRGAAPAEPPPLKTDAVGGATSSPELFLTQLLRPCAESLVHEHKRWEAALELLTAAPVVAAAAGDGATSAGEVVADEEALITAEVGDQLVAEDSKGIWADAKVVGVRGGDGAQRELRVHFIGWNARYDEWIPTTDGRLRATRDEPMASAADGESSALLNFCARCIGVLSDIPLVNVARSAVAPPFFTATGNRGALSPQTTTSVLAVSRPVSHSTPEEWHSAGEEWARDRVPVRPPVSCPGQRVGPRGPPRRSGALRSSLRYLITDIIVRKWTFAQPANPRRIGCSARGCGCTVHGGRE
jgi:hypothetical protein